MDKESLKTGTALLQDFSSLNISLLNNDLHDLIVKMKFQRISSQEQPVSMILLNCPDKKGVIIILHEVSDLKTFQANSKSVQKAGGRI